MTNEGQRPPLVTLQISLAPPDVRHAGHTIAHQLRVWGPQVHEILFVVDRRPEQVGSVDDNALRRLLVRNCEQHPNARIRYVDDSPLEVSRIARRWTGRRRMPTRDYRAGAIHSFLFGLDVARHDFVLHSDSDMLFGGGSQSWVDEALELLSDRPNAVAVSPLPGPPTDDGRLPDDVARRHVLAHRPPSEAPGFQPQREPHASLAYRFSGISWRVCLIDRDRFVERLTPIRLRHARPRQSVLALLDGNAPYTTLENSVSRAMLERGLYRIDFLGRAPGVWSLHPPYRSEEFYSELPSLIERVETGDVPAGQRGDYELNDALIDWTAAREARRRQRRWRRVRARPVQSHAL